MRGRTLAAGLAFAVAAAALAAQVWAPAGSVATVSERLVIGKSVRGKPISAIQIGDPAGTRVVLVVGAIHGDERLGLRILESIERRVPDPAALDGTQLWLIPTVNPDGMRLHTRKNARAVDLNRNFPYRWRSGPPRSSGHYPGPRPASEPETRAVMRFVRQVRPALSIWYHQPWGAVLACRGRPRLAVEYANLVGMRTSCRGTGLRGTAISWETHAISDSTAFVVELAGGKLRGSVADRHARAALTIAEDG